MAGLTEDEVRHVAKLARLKLTDEEVKKFAPQLSSILDYVDILNELDTERIPPTAQITGLSNVKREDAVLQSEASKEELLGCSPLPIVNDLIETLSAHG
jgi:aspartyl-tRNA(Asn)/glutamyl-tRNA(Gln) amidotransferase subunit C